MSNFNLNREIQQWRKSLQKYQGLEQGTAEELMSHVTDAIDDLVASGMTEEEAFKKVTREKIGDLKSLSEEYLKAKSIMSNPSPRFTRSLATNFIKVAYRNILKNRPHSIINLVGLAIGLASVIIISVYTYAELGFDKFHHDHQRIYRVLNKLVRSGNELVFPQGPPALAPALTANFPEVELATRIRYADRPLIQYGDASYYEDHAFYADSSFLKIFDFNLLRGNRLTALNQPNTVILSEKIAKKYFGNDDPINKILIMDGGRPLQVTGVAEEVPHNSHFSFEMLISFQTFVVPPGYLEDIHSYVWMGFLTYAKTVEGADIRSLESKVVKHYKTSDKRYEDRDISIAFQPLADIYLGSADLSNPHNIFRVNSYTTIYSLMAVGILIILIASFNYINLSIAMSMSRFKEIAMRKVLGSTKGKLVTQFIMESILYALISLIMGAALVFSLLQILPTNITSRLYLSSNGVVLYGLALVAFVILLGIVSGIFPALRLASLTSLDMLKGTFKLKDGPLRNVLIGFQFALSAALIAISLVIGKQIEFFSNKSLGYTRDGIISINVGADQVSGQVRVIKNQLRTIAGVSAISHASHGMGEGLSSGPLHLREQEPDDAIQMNYIQSDYDFLKTMGLELVDGRFFSEDIHRDSTESIVLNEAAVKTLGLTNPLGQKVIFTTGPEKEIIGVVKDFHYNSLHQRIAPMAIIMPFGIPRNLIVHIQSNNLYRTINEIESSWQKTFPNVPIEVSFLDETLRSLYEKEELFANVIQFFTVLATAIACLGLYSLAAISLAGKIKQISIRRVLGAPVKSVMLLVGKNFLLLVIISTLVSWPLVWYVMNRWLSNFAYHIDLSAWFFVVTVVAILAITIVTISYHLYKAITINPAETLRDN